MRKSVFIFSKIKRPNNNLEIRYLKSYLGDAKIQFLMISEIERKSI